ncbi:MAG: hypothetical protein EZS28_025141, partial [Streblomastix strix]
MLLFISLLFLTVLHSTDEAQWRRIKTLLPPLRGHSSIEINNETIVVFGGENDIGDVRNTHYILNKTGAIINEYYYKEDVIPSRSHHGYVSIGSSNYLIVGGKTRSQVLGDIYIYNFKDKNFTQHPKLPDNIKVHSFGCASSSDGEVAVIFGGENEDGIMSNQLLVARKANKYNFEVIYPNCTSFVPALVGCRLSYKNMNNQHQYYFTVSGGITSQFGSEPVIYQIVIDLSQKITTAKFERFLVRPQQLVQRSYHFAGIFYNQLFLWGGTLTSLAIEKLNLDDHSFYSIEPIQQSSNYPPPVYDFALCQSDDQGQNELYIIGGIDQRKKGSESFSSDMWIYKFDPCYQHSKTCKQCREAVGKCVWCGSKHTCVTSMMEDPDQSQSYYPQYERCSTSTVDNVTQCESQQQDQKQCSEFIECDQCLQRKGCGWCQSVAASPQSYFGCLEGTNRGPRMGVCREWLFGDNNMNMNMDMDITSQLEDEEHESYSNKKNEINSKCSSILPIISFNSPKIDDVLAFGDILFIGWNFSKQDVNGWASVYLEYMESSKVIFTELVSEYIHDAFQGWVHQEIKFGDVYQNADKLRIKIVIHSYTQYSDDESKQIIQTYYSSPINVRRITIDVIRPAPGDIIRTGETFDIKLELHNYTGLIYLALYDQELLDESVEFIGVFSNQSTIQWNPTSVIPSKSSYIIIVRQLFTQFALGHSVNFTVQNQDYIRLILPEAFYSPNFILYAGSSLSFEWESGDGINNVKVALYLAPEESTIQQNHNGDKQRKHVSGQELHNTNNNYNDDDSEYIEEDESKSQLIELLVVNGTRKGSITWTSQVNESSNRYYLWIGDKVASSFNRSKRFKIEAPSISVFIGNYVTHKDVNYLTTDEQVSIWWEYRGQQSDKILTLNRAMAPFIDDEKNNSNYTRNYNQKVANEEDLVIYQAKPHERSFIWTLPSK